MIMIVDSEAGVLTEMAKVLHDLKHEDIVCFASATKAVDSIDKAELVICEFYMLPLAGTYDYRDCIREFNTPFLFMSAFSYDKMAVKHYGLKKHSFMQKPIDKIELRIKIDYLTGKLGL